MTLVGVGMVLVVLAGWWWGSASRRRLQGSDHRSWARRQGEALVSRVRRSWRRSARAAARRRAGADVVLALAAELATGLPLDLALTRAAAGRPIVATAIGAARVGGDIPTALRSDAEREELPVLSALAAVWQVSAGSGAGLSDAAYRLGTAALQRERMRRDLAAQMAGTRTTARVLALLPVVGLLLGSGLGGSPVAWLFTTPLGLLALAAGVMLEIVGIWWVRRLVTSVERLL